MFPLDVRLPEAAPRSPRRRQRWVQGIRETVSVSHLSTASPSKSHSHGHAHSPSPVHFAMQQWGRGSDERLLLATTPVLGGMQQWGGRFCTATGPAVCSSAGAEAEQPHLAAPTSRWARIKSPQGPRASWEPTATGAGRNSGLHPGYSRCI